MLKLYEELGSPTDTLSGGALGPPEWCLYGGEQLGNLLLLSKFLGYRMGNHNERRWGGGLWLSSLSTQPPDKTNISL